MDEGTPLDVDRIVPPAVGAASEGRRRSLRARQRRPACGEFRPGLASARKASREHRAVLDAGEDAAGPRDDRLGPEDEGLAIARDVVTGARTPRWPLALEYALMLASTGHDEEARADAHAVRQRQDGRPGAPCADSVRCSTWTPARLDAAEKRDSRNCCRPAPQSYEALYYLGVVAERRKDADRAIRYYSRVVGGDYAIAAQQRVARIKAEQSGVDAGLAHLEEFGRTQPQSGPEVVAARAALRPRSRTTSAHWKC